MFLRGSPLPGIPLLIPSHPFLQALILQALSEQIRIHPATYRSHAPHLQKLCTDLINQRRELVPEISSLLATLHLTGKGREVQTQLWTTTLDLLIKDAKSAWAACSSSFAANLQDEENQAGLLLQLPADNLDALTEAHSRLALLLGSPPSAGIIAYFLAEPTAHAVPVPLDEVVSLILSILSITPFSLPRLQPAPESTLLAAQTSLLPSTHVSALTMLASLPLQTYYSKSSKVIFRVLKIIERSSPAVRCVAFKVLMELDLPLDPESQLLIDYTRTCLAQAARLVKASGKATKKEPKAGRDKTSKRRKMYESDQVQFTQKKGFVEMDQDEYQGCVAAIECLPLLYEGLATNLTPEHYDLAHTCVLLLLGITEISLQDADNLTATTLQVLAQLIRLSRGPLLALMITRTASLASQGFISYHYETKKAAGILSQALELTLNPRLAPKLSLRLYIEDDFRKGEDHQDIVLDKVELEEDRGAKVVEAMREVLEIRLDEQKLEAVSMQSSPSASSLLESPRRSTFTPLQHSPDPVKPIHRPNTPRIGSPSISNSVARNSIGNNVSSSTGTSTSSPERPTTNTQLFGASSTLSTTTMTTTVTAKSGPTPRDSSPLGHSQDIDMMDNSNNADDDDSDDEGIPELDLRSSDEED